jgi:hypothetical protein
MANNFETWVEGYVDELQDVDTAATDLLVLTTIDGASGVQLDGLGQIVGIARQGLEDDPYRSLIRAYIKVNISGGTIEDMNEIVRLATNTSVADGAFGLTEGGLAEFSIECTQALPAGVGLIAAEAMYQGKPGGVHAVFIYHETEPVFAFDGFGGSQMGNDPLPGDSGYYLRGAIRNRGARESEIL